MTPEALSGYHQRAAEDYSPPDQQEDNLEGLNLFPTTAEDFERYFKSLSSEQKSFERRLYIQDLIYATADYAFFPWVQLQLRASLTKKEKSTLIIGPGLGTVALGYKGTELYFQGEGHPTAVYSPRWVVNIGPLDERDDEHYMEFLFQKRRESNGPVDVLLHSMQGLHNRYVASKYGDEYYQMIGKIIYLGSPVPSWVNSYLGERYMRFLNLVLNGNKRRFRNVLESGESDNVSDAVIISVYNPNDPVLKGKSSGRQILVDGPHSSMQMNMNILAQVKSVLEDNFTTTPAAPAVAA